jgi:hypothetical protein
VPPPGYGQAPVGQPWQQAPPATGTNGLAIAGFVLALVWVCGIGSILGIVFGFVALSQIKSSRQTGRGLAIAGIVLGFLGIIATVVSIVVLVNEAEDAFEEDPNERDDVSIVSCTPETNGDAGALIEITNDSSRNSFYLITVEFSDGDDTIRDSFTIDDVDPDETATARFTAGRALRDGYDCELVRVDRFATIQGDETND